ncbi:MAG: hypothetical protein M1816_000575 [Peltula sp. TS41687]|nr:MAG: hypothetical protein M1816_000575 [Peltula sp. TS41687]
MLHAVSEPLADLVFVHGLGGGSRSTWGKTNHPLHYWPKEWLPRDPDFKHVRIHTFGYKADWGEKKGSVLDIQDFAHSLLGELKDNPDIRKDKAYILARQDLAFAELAARFHTVCFLATPHRGSDLTRTLANILKVTYGHKAYVNELERNSSSIATINDAFRHYAKDLKLYSFYETVTTDLKLFNAMVVDKGSATLGYEHERIVPLNADHRNVLRNALGATVEDITNEVSAIRDHTSRLDQRRLTTLTGISEIPEDDLNVLEDSRLTGSCEWLTSKTEFEEWRTPWSGTAQIFWLNGNPAAGKSVLSGHVINHLGEYNLNCSYFFFKHGTTSKSSISDCLRSLAYQMAVGSTEVRGKLLELEADGVVIENNDERTIWRKLFSGAIFQTRSSQPYYWVIDALDECTKFHSFFSLISKIPWSLRIFVTSRKVQEIEQGFIELGGLVTSQQISVSDTIPDIKLVIASRFDRLPLADDESQENFIERILEKSAGSFLWVRLVIQELEHTWSEEAAEEVLNKIPVGMDSLYARTLENMSMNKGGTKLAKAILTWTICASRPLTLDEMQHALKLDIKETIHKLERLIASTCGQLLFVDQSSRIQLIHQTAKDFLLQEDLVSEFAVKKTESHTRIAVSCLKYLAQDYFKVTRSRKQNPTFNPRQALDSAFVDYACTFFSDHLYKSSSAESVLMDTLCEFLNTSVFSWIEYLAKTGDLYHITRTATNMKAYLGRRIKHVPPISQQVQKLEAWIIDLIRVSVRFRTTLLTSPSSIHWLIPPVCPAESIIAKTCASRSSQRELVIKGLKATTWDDCLAQINYRGCQATAVAHGDRCFAVGLSTGKTILYHNVSVQVKRIVDHLERVKILEIGSEDKLLVSSGARKIRVWDINSGNQVWASDTPHSALALAFGSDNESLVIATQGSYTASWGLLDGCEMGQLPWNIGFEEGTMPSRALFSSDCRFLAVSYRRRPVFLFDLENECPHGSCIRDAHLGEEVTHYAVDAMAFQPSPEINFLIASYGDGELTVYDLYTTELRYRIDKVYAHSLACSPDGRSLVTGSSNGTIQVFDFGGTDGEILTLIYRINAYEDGIRSLTFSNDSLRFIDIRGSQCRVWEPAILVRNEVNDSSQSELSCSAPVPPNTVGMLEGLFEAEITALSCHADGDTIFCGRQDGCVAVYRASDAQEHCILYKHAFNVTVTHLVWGEQKSILFSADESGRIMILNLIKAQGLWSASDTLADQRFPDSINGLLTNPINDRVLVSGKDFDELWTTQGEKVQSKAFTQESRRAICHPLHSELFIILGVDVARIFKWASFEELTSGEGIRLNRLSEPIVADGSLTISCQGHHIIVELLRVLGHKSSARLECWRASDIQANSGSVGAIQGFEMLGPGIEHIIAVTGTTLLFLDTDLWVCSIDLKTFTTAPQAKRHFFIPSEWLSCNGDIILQLTSKDEFVFAKKNDLVVIKRGLDFEETLSLSRAQQCSFSQGSTFHSIAPL